MNLSLSALHARVWARTRPRLSRLVYTNGGIGDELMLTAIARAARTASRPLHILTEMPGIWKGNTDPASIQLGVDRWLYARRRAWLPTEIAHLSYQNGTGRHIAAQMAEKAGVSLPPGWRPIFAFARPAARQSRLLVLQNSCRGARFAADTKEWAQARWEVLAQRLSLRFNLVQIGTRSDPPLPGARDLRGRTRLREAADLMAGAAAFVGLESGLMHLAAAVGTPGVILYGGRTRPEETGYSWNVNLTRAPACAGCGLNSGCPHRMICMDIPVEEAEAAVEAALRTQVPSP